MSDIISRLLDEAEKAQRKGHLLLAEVCRDASDRIGLLEHDNEQLRAGAREMLEAVERAKADEIERLRAALRNIVQGWDWWGVDSYNRCQSVPGDAIEEARALLENSHE